MQLHTPYIPPVSTQTACNTCLIAPAVVKVVRLDRRAKRRQPNTDSVAHTKVCNPAHQFWLRGRAFRRKLSHAFQAQITPLSPEQSAWQCKSRRLLLASVFQEGSPQRRGYDVNCHLLGDRNKQRCPHERRREDKNDWPFSNEANLSDTCFFNFKVFSQICVG